jgi:hypothetical protein
MSIIELIFGHGNKLEKIQRDLDTVKRVQIDQGLVLNTVAQAVLSAQTTALRELAEIRKQLNVIQDAVIAKHHLSTCNPSFGHATKSDRRT